jgi:hypothetical protein
MEPTHVEWNVGLQEERLTKGDPFVCCGREDLQTLAADTTTSAHDGTVAVAVV